MIRTGFKKLCKVQGLWGPWVPKAPSHTAFPIEQDSSGDRHRFYQRDGHLSFTSRREGCRRVSLTMRSFLSLSSLQNKGRQRYSEGLDQDSKRQAASFVAAFPPPPGWESQRRRCW